MAQPSAPASTGANFAFCGLSSFIVLLPFGRLSELGVLLCLLASGFFLRERSAITPTLRSALICFGAIWLAALMSSLDSFDPQSSLICVISMLRFAALLIAAHMLRPSLRHWLNSVVAACLAIWCLDALVQTALGYSIGGSSYGDRISGVFGKDNLKLGLALAVFSPFLLFAAERLKSRASDTENKSRTSETSVNARVIVVWLIVAAVTLLAGARAGWVMFALISLLWGLRLSGYKLRRTGFGFVIAVMLTLTLAAILNATNARFAERMARSAAIFNPATADFALAGRVPIWQTAARMAVAHPVNGVGVRAFRYAYPQYARSGDPWLQKPHGADMRATGATHPHQLLFEILTETGLIGLALWGFAALVLTQCWRRADVIARAHAWPYGCALLALTFPINTHTALYSSFWAGVLWWLIAGLCASLQASETSTRDRIR